jgi:hypothetical protein
MNIAPPAKRRRSPPLPPKLSPPKTHARRPEHPHSAPPKRSPPKTHARRPEHPHSAPPKRSPPKTHVRQRKVFEITDTLTKEQKMEQKMEEIKKLNAEFIEYIRKRKAGTLPPFKKEEVSAFDQLDKWIKKYDKLNRLIR